MNSSVTASFRQALAALPAQVQERARKQYRLWQSDHRHPSLHFKRVGSYWSARVDKNHRVLGLEQEGRIYWFWIGPHDEYEDRL
ncbi:MAG: hypothetical protein JNM65_15475 [Verrucomicrobiaceae bacterium]|nr:hypothetical protein [Verrucomicrobiaceae bacterium]